MRIKQDFGSVAFLVITFVVLMTFSVWYYVRGGFQSYSKTESTVITEHVVDLVPTLHWKTYKSEQFKFEIKYPPHWDEPAIVVPEGTVTFSTSGWRMFSLYPITKDKWIECDKLNKESTQDVPELGCHMNFIAEKDNVYVWSHPQDYPDELENDVGSIPQVISTFKFTDPDLETSDWKTYKNEKYGFEFKYPNTWNYEIGSSVDKYNNVPFNVYFSDGKYSRSKMGVSVYGEKIPGGIYETKITQSVNLNDRDMVAYLYPGGYECGMEAYGTDDCLYLSIPINNKYKYVIWFSEGSISTSTKNILSTFKFTN